MRATTRRDRPRPAGPGLIASATLVALAGLLAACGDSGVQADSAPTAGVTSAASPSPSPAVDPNVQAALDAYARYNAAALYAYAHPWSEGDTFPAEANYLAYSFDPERASTTAYVHQMASLGAALRGNQPQSHVEATAVHLDSKPYPTVVLTDCKVADGTWSPHYVDDGSPVPTSAPDPGAAPPPNPSVVTMIYDQKHWGVQRSTFDASATCTP